MPNLIGQGDRSIRKGAAGIRRGLTDKGWVVGDFAMVWNDVDEQECYIIREGKPRSYVTTVQWWDCDEEKTQEFLYEDREKAIKFFLRILDKLKRGAIVSVVKQTTTEQNNG